MVRTKDQVISPSVLHKSLQFLGHLAALKENSKIKRDMFVMASTSSSVWPIPELFKASQPIIPICAWLVWQFPRKRILSNIYLVTFESAWIPDLLGYPRLGPLWWFLSVTTFQTRWRALQFPIALELTKHGIYTVIFPLPQAWTVLSYAQIQIPTTLKSCPTYALTTVGASTFHVPTCS